MKQRSISAVGVVIVGLVPAIMGGPVWAVAFAVLCALAFHEYRAMAARISPNVQPYGYALVPAFAIPPFLDHPERALVGVTALAISLPLVESTFRRNLEGSFVDWALASAGVLYLGLPLYAAIELRNLPGAVDREWLSDLAGSAAFDWDASERGLAWLVTVILCTWLSDTFAYLAGRSIGKRKLSPVVSPNKSVEGFLGGVIAASVTGAISFWLFGLDNRVWIGLFVGAVLAIVGLFGDLAESVLKRAAGVKDSGGMIPGHGGMLDRLDALIFTFVAGWYLAVFIDNVVL